MATTPEQQEAPASYGDSVEFRVLGPLEVVHEGVRLELGGPKQRTALAILIANAGSSVSVGTLIEGIYGEDAPDRAHRSVHTFISNLRGAVGEVIERRGDGYEFTAVRTTSDALRFEDSVFRAGEHQDPGEARSTGIVVVWDMDSGSVAAEIPIEGDTGEGLRGIVFLDNETILVAPEAGTHLFRFSLNSETLRQEALDSVNRGFSAEECATYNIDPCPTLEEMRARS